MSYNTNGCRHEQRGNGGKLSAPDKEDPMLYPNESRTRESFGGASKVKDNPEEELEREMTSQVGK